MSHTDAASDVALLTACAAWMEAHETEKALWAEVDRQQARAAAEGQQSSKSPSHKEIEAEATALLQAERRHEICALPAYTAQGLYAKARVMKADGFVFPGQDGDTSTSNECAEQIFNDIARIAGGAVRVIS